MATKTLTGLDRLLNDYKPTIYPQLNKMQSDALLQLKEKGLPSLRVEDWKYTSIEAILNQEFHISKKNSLPSFSEADFLFSHFKGPRLVFINGQFSPDHSKLDSFEKGLRFKTLHQALEHSSESFKKYFGKIAKPISTSLLPLNTAMMQDGYCLEVAPNTILEQPIQVIYIQTADQPLALYPRNMIILGENSQARMIEHSWGYENQHFVCAVTEIVLEAGAQLKHYKIQQEAKTAYHLAGIYVEQQGDSQFISQAINLGAVLSRQDIEVDLAASGAHCTLNGLYVLDGHQHHDTHSRIDHRLPHGTSREYYKGILKESSRAVFNGKVIVHPKAIKTDAEQYNKNLLLSNDAEVDTKPQLEIFVDDVKCAHGATVGQLDPEALFFLRSRGLDEQMAKTLLIDGFMADIFDAMQWPEIEAILKTLLVIPHSHPGPFII